MQGIFIGQVFWAWNQQVVVELSMSPQKVSVHQTVKITVKSNTEGDIVENWPAEFVKTNRMQSSWQYVQDAKLGSVKQEYSVVFTGSFNKKGSYHVGPFHLKVGNKTYASNVLMICVEPRSTDRNLEHISHQQLLNKAFAVVEASTTSVYEGEPIVMCGKVYSKERTFGSPILKRNYSIDGVSDVHAIPQDQQWETVTVNGQEYASFVFDEKVLFPVGNQTLTVQPFDMYLSYGFHGVHVRSTVPTIKVLPLPADPPKNFNGGVGEFEITQRCRAKTIKLGDVIEVEVVVSGQGNLHTLETPKLTLPKTMTAYGKPQINEEYDFCMYGAKGKVTYIFPIQVNSKGKHTIPPVSIAYFQPKKKLYVQTKATLPTEIEVESDPVKINDFSSSEQLAAISSDERSFGMPDSSSDRLELWIWGLGTSLSIVCGASLFLLIRRRNKQQDGKQATNNAQNNIDDNQTVNLEAYVKEMLQQTIFYFNEQQTDNFYACMEKTLMALMKFKMQQPSDSRLLRSELIAMLHQHNDPYSSNIECLFKECDAARYGQMTPLISQEHMIEELKKIV